MNKTKGLLASILTFALCVLIALGSFSMLAITASANGSNPFVTNQTTFFSDFANIQRRVRLGDNFVVPVENDNVTLTITAPNGRNVRLEDYVTSTDVTRSFTAMQIGNYTVRFACNDCEYNVYEYLVNSFEDRAFTIEIDECRETFMPGFRRATRGVTNLATPADGLNLDTLRLPRFFLSYTNERGELAEVNEDDVVYEVRFTPNNADIRLRGTTSNLPATNGVFTVTNNAVQNGNLELHNLRVGMLSVILTARLAGSESRFYTREFSVNVQNIIYEDLSRPTLSIINPPNAHNINTRFTVPVVAASDAFSNNVFVETVVLDPSGNPVLDFVACENGFVLRDENGVPIDEDGNPITEVARFNNRNNRSFFPTNIGIYTIRTTAFNGWGQRSVLVQEYTVNVRDRLAPRITHLEDSSIPSHWGRDRITRINPNTGNNQVLDTVANTSFLIPFPEVIDNHTSLDDLSVTIIIQNPNNRPVARWVGTVSAFADGDGVAISSHYNWAFLSDYQNLRFSRDNGVYFSFNMINWADSRLAADIDRHGTWSIIYQVRDAENNGGSGTARRQVFIEVQDHLPATTRPTVDAAHFRAVLPEYVLIEEGRETFNAPNIVARDDRFTRFVETYTIRSTATDALTAYRQASFVDGGITFTVTGYNEASALDINGGADETFIVRRITRNTAATGAAVYQNFYYLTLVDGRDAWAIPLTAGANNRASITLAYTVENGVGNRWRQRNEADTAYEYVLTAEVDFLFAGSIEQTLEMSGLVGGDNDRNTRRPQGTVRNLGGFNITGIEHKAYTGFEITLRDPNGDIINTTSYSFHVRHAEDYYSLHVRNITAAPTVPGVYSLLIRAFDISGISQIQAFTFYVYEVNRPGYGVGPGGNGSTTPGTGGGTTSAPSAGPTAGRAVAMGAGGVRAITMGSEGFTHTPYRLDDLTGINIARPPHYPAPSDFRPILVRRIVGPSFSLAGNEFTALTTGSFTVENHFVNEYTVDTHFGGLINADNAFPLHAINRTTGDYILDADGLRTRFFDARSQLGRPRTISISESVDMIIDVYGFMPTYMPHPRPVNRDTGRGGQMPIDQEVWFPNEFIQLPIFIAHSRLGNAPVIVSASFSPTAGTSHEHEVMQLYRRVDDQGRPLYMHFANNETHNADATTRNSYTLSHNAPTGVNNPDDFRAFSFDEDGYASRRTGVRTPILDEHDDPTGEYEYEYEIHNYIPTGIWAFATDRDGRHTISVSAAGQYTAHRSFEIRIGRTSVPVAELVREGLQTTGEVGITYFRHPRLDFRGAATDDFDTIIVNITNPDGTAIVDGGNANRTFSRAAWLARSEADFETDFVFNRAGDFLVTITVRDTATDLDTIITYTITVDGDPLSQDRDWTALTVVLIIIGVALILGAIVYAVRFKPKKVDTKQNQGI